uniref:Myb/SANT-like DNA-binding domain-containing protein n=1 Tax=Aegilops tauschii subsp. strangulata TaxID=200361 RepID=A0A453M387_AEGTS
PRRRQTRRCAPPGCPAGRGRRYWCSSRASAWLNGATGEGAAAALEPKWAAVAEYCRRHGVERGAVQCRKRWSNLAGDWKKIKEWERAAAGAREPSFWAMRNDARRERRLPGFFDREVYGILEGRGRGVVAGSSSGGDAAMEEVGVEREGEGGGSGSGDRV